MRRRLAAMASAAAALAATALAGCGDGGDESAGKQRLVVSAASSLTEALRDCSRGFGRAEGAEVRLSFAGSDELAAQIRRGVRPDLFAAANTKLPDELARDGLVDRTVTFASNQLVLAVPEDSEIQRVEDLAVDGVKLAVGAPSVPVGAYTREVLGRLPARTERRVLRGVRTEEPDVKGVVGKLVQGAADAGFVYASDVRAAEGRLRAVPLDPELEPEVAYGAAVVRGARSPALGRRFLDGMLDGPCARALRDAGFGPPPRT